jgi:4-diphosphocytidyl-2-C-methyl-D-erythritol kinase
VVAAQVELAPAKVNLTLRVIARRSDGYHEIESLVAFAGVADRLSITPDRALALAVGGPMAAGCGELPQNLVLKAASALSERVAGLKIGHFQLSKRLPVAAGLGGGSSDAAAALRLLARANGLTLADPRVLEAARATGADVPVCLEARARVMRGIGDVLSHPVKLPRIPALLVNPGVMLATRDVFGALELHKSSAELTGLQPPGGAQAKSPVPEIVAMLEHTGNDLEKPAIRLQPVIADVLRRLAALTGCRLARMSGSGATCFGLFATAREASLAARQLRAEHPAWWIRATTLGG